MSVTNMHEFTLKPGVKAGTKIRFQGEADEKPGMQPGDVILVVKEKKNEKMERDGNDLIIKEKVSLADALTGELGRNHPYDFSSIGTATSDAVRFLRVRE